MDILIALAHITGSVVVMFLLGFGILMLSAWELDRNTKNALAELSIKLNIPIDEIENEEHTNTIIKAMSEENSSEKFTNRFSDLCGYIRITWNVFISIIVISIIIGVSWLTYDDHLNNAIYAWSVIPVYLVGVIISILFSLICKVLTNKHPGQARSGRKYISKYLENHNSV